MACQTLIEKFWISLESFIKTLYELFCVIDHLDQSSIEEEF